MRKNASLKSNLNYLDGVLNVSLANIDICQKNFRDDSNLLESYYQRIKIFTYQRTLALACISFSKY